MIIVIINENLRPTQKRWSTLAIVEVSYSSFTLIREVWPIVYNVLKEGGLEAGFKIPMLPLNQEQVNEMNRKAGDGSSRNLPSPKTPGTAHV